MFMLSPKYLEEIGQTMLLLGGDRRQRLHEDATYLGESQEASLQQERPSNRV
jgi:hypothetical protein